MSKELMIISYIVWAIICLFLLYKIMIKVAKNIYIMGYREGIGDIMEHIKKDLNKKP